MHISCVIMKYKGISIESISIFKTPAIYLELTLLLIIDIFTWLKNFIIRRAIALIVATTLWLLISYVHALQVNMNIFRPLKTSSTSLHIGYS
jgi:hypothetical protein